MDKEYTLSYIEHEKNHWWFTARKEILEKMIGKIILKKNYPSALNILNVGPGGGATSLMLEKYGKVKSLEFDMDLFNYCRDVKKIDVDNGSITALPYADGSFDVACAFDVIEHVEDDAKAMQELQRVVKKDGLIFITVPAFRFLWSRHDVLNHHYRRYTKNSLDTLGENMQLSVSFSTYFNFFLFLPILAARVFEKLKLKSDNKSDSLQLKTSPRAGKFLHALFSAEKKILFPAKFPFGVSVFAAFTK